jgi:hypothetical protein
MTIKLSDWAGVKSIRSLSYTSGILQASQLDTLLAADIPHNLNALPDSLELWVEQGGGQWEQHDPSAYVLADDTNLVNTGTTLASVLGATTLVRLTASSGPVAISVGLADSGQAGLIAGLGNQTLSPALSLENTLSILPTTNQLVLGTTDTTTISATAPASSAVYTIPDVGTTADFVMTAGAQDIGGAKTFLASPTFPATVNYVSVGSITKGGAGALTLTAAGVSSITVPTVTGTMITSADTGTVTNTMLAGSIADSKLSTITTAGKVSNSATTATASNNANTIVARNAVGDFAAGTISASLNGNATTASSATVLATARNIWGQSFNGSANISGAITGATTIQMGTQANKATLTYTTNTTRTYTIPDAGANADFVMTAGNQTIAGRKSFSSKSYWIAQTNQFNIDVVGNSGRIDKYNTFFRFISYSANATNNSQFEWTTANSTGGAAATIGYTSGTAWLKPGGGTWGDSSDIRLKKNILSVSESFLSRICATDVITYEWKEGLDNRPQGRQLGFSAQGLQSTFPEYVFSKNPREDEEQHVGQDQVLAVSFDNSVYAVFFKTIKELNDKIDAAEARIAQLEGSN